MRQIGFFEASPESKVLLPLRGRQIPAIDKLKAAIREGHKHFVAQGATGFGKCHGAGTEVIMYDGSLRKVEDVMPGDQLMGPDSTPRLVLNITRGWGDLFAVIPKRGELFVCNDVHVLSLKQTKLWNKHGEAAGGKGCGGRLVNIPLNKYLDRSKTFKHQYKLWRTGIEFRGHNLPLAPYALGVFLGDGSISKSPAVTTMDPEIVEEIHRVAGEFGLHVRQQEMKGNKASVYFLVGEKGHKNLLRQVFISLGLGDSICGDKFIPATYLTGDRFQRLELLAGLIDTDGHVFLNSKSVEFSSKSPRLIADVSFLCRSLGFGVGSSSREINGTRYYRINIIGDYRCIPTRIARKRVTKKREQKKDPLVSGFRVESIGQGNYYGFSLSGDCLYLLRDFTVTHNTNIAAHMVDSCLRRGNKALFVAPSVNLVDQTLTRFEDQGIWDVGVMQAQHHRTRRDAALQIACMKTLMRRPVVEGVKLVLVDECHEGSQFLFDLMANQWKDILVIGFSATPWARGMGLHYTKLVVLATMKELMEDGAPTGLCKWWGYGVPPEFTPDMSGVPRIAGQLNESGVSKVMSGRAIVGNTVDTWLKHRQLGHHPGDRTFLYGVDRAHAKALMEAFKAQDVSFGYMDGETSTDDRKRIFEAYDAREIKGICNVGVLITGVDRDVRCISDCCYTESEMRLVQQHGRGMRLKLDDDAMLFVLDHAGNRDRLGRPEDIHHHTLDCRGPNDKGEAFSEEMPTPKPRTCKKCSVMIPPKTKVCPACGDVWVAENKVEHVAGELVEFGAEGKKKKEKAGPTLEQQQEWFSGFLGLAQQREKSEGWAAHRYFLKFKEWPPKNLKPVPTPPSREVLGFDKHARLKFVKGKEKAAAAQRA